MAVTKYYEKLCINITDVAAIAVINLDIMMVIVIAKNNLISLIQIIK
jgi:hypothetical protein